MPGWYEPGLIMTGMTFLVPDVRSWLQSMTPAGDLDAFLNAAPGHCYVGRTSVIWCAKPDLVGLIQWGVLDEASVREMVSILERIRGAAMPPAGRLLVDFRRVSAVDAEVLVGFAALARQRLPVWSRRIAKQAVIIPEGVTGVLLAGALPSATPQHPLRYVRTLHEAVAFLGDGVTEPHLEAMTFAANARDRAPLIVRLRHQLAGDLIDASVDRSAAALVVSPRTLQRELERNGTCFRDELRRARVAAAEELLASNDDKIDTIAGRVGFASGSRLSAAIRRERNVTASALRARLRTKES